MSDLIRVTLQPENLQAGPGVEVQAEIEVRNASGLVDAYSIEVLGLDPGWFRLSSAELPLFPGDSGTVSLMVLPPVGGEAAAKSYEFTIKVVSSVDPTNETSIRSSLEVEPAYSFDMNIFPEKVTGTAGSFNLSIANTGNAQLAFALEGSDPEGFCRFSFEPEEAVVPPWEKLDVAVTARPRRRPVYGKPKTYNLTVNATPDKTPELRTLHVQLDAIARVRKWYIPVTIASLVLLLVIGYSTYWAVSLRADWTYFGAETWDAEVTFKDSLLHGQVYPFMFEFHSTVEDGSAPELVEDLKLRIDVIWPEILDVAPSIELVLRSPEGKCSLPEKVGRTDAPFPHSLVFQDACKDVPFGEFLMDLTNDDAPKPSVYNHGSPILEYCVANLGQPDERVVYEGSNPKRYEQYIASTGGQWTLFIMHQHPTEQPPESVTVKLKAANENGDPPPGLFFFKGKRKHDEFSLNLTKTLFLNAESEQVSASTDRCGTQWDDAVTLIGRNENGIEHGTVFVRPLEVSPREGAPSQPIQEVLIEATWGKGEGGGIIAERVFIVLRDGHGNCWTTVQGQTSEHDPETMSELPVASQQDSCRDQLAGQLLWNFINWNTFEPSAYEGVQPLVRFCPHQQGTTLFSELDAVPRVFEPSWEANTTQGWNLYIINPDYIAAPPQVTLKVRGDDNWQLKIIEPANSSLGAPPLVPASTCDAPSP
jgi:hypothetical protein